MIRRRKTQDELMDRYGVDTDSLKAIVAYMPTDIKAIRSFAIAAESDTERRFRLFLRDFAVNNFGGTPQFVGHSWWTFKIPGGGYTPDWCILIDGQWVFVENKASKKQANYRDARSKLRAAAALNPWFRFYEVRLPYKKAKRPENIVDGWVLEYIPPEVSFVTDIINMLQEVANE